MRLGLRPAELPQSAPGGLVADFFQGPWMARMPEMQEHFPAKLPASPTFFNSLLAGFIDRPLGKLLLILLHWLRRVCQSPRAAASRQSILPAHSPAAACW